MDDVPEGGGGPTGIVVPSGTSNAIFPDVSESDRAIGNVRMRKLVLGVRTDDTDTFLGSNIVIAEPPDDENVDMCLFGTGDMFDERQQAVARLEAYLNIGTSYAGYLYGNHIAGQNTLLIFQKTDELPFIGATLALTKREGFSDQVVEYVRVTEAKGQMREFEDSSGKFSRYILELKLQNFLSADFGGFDITRFEITQDQLAQRTKISNTVVADAARYYGVKRLDAPAVIGDFTIKAESMFAQLVPSAQIETPIADARTNQLNGAVVSSGDTIVLSVSAVFTTTSNLFVGGGIAPNSFSITDTTAGGGAVVVTDAGGKLMLGGTQVGNIEYENGVLSLTTNVFGAGGAGFTITYKPAAPIQTVTESQGFEITAENRSLSYVRTIEPVPTPGTMAVSYMAGGRWYVLRDDGSGALRGATSAFGAGYLNPTSGTLSITLGALPDVGSSLIFVWVPPAGSRGGAVLQLDNDNKLYWPMNTAGVSSLAPGPKLIEPNGVDVSWTYPSGFLRTVTDDGKGNLFMENGVAAGTVDYGDGTLRLSPQALPPKGTQINLTLSTASKEEVSLAVTGAAAGGQGSFGSTDITPGSVRMEITAQVRGSHNGSLSTVDWGGPGTFVVTDDGAGKLMVDFAGGKLQAGTVDYVAGTFKFQAAFGIPEQNALIFTAFDDIQQGVTYPPIRMMVGNTLG